MAKAVEKSWLKFGSAAALVLIIAALGTRSWHPKTLVIGTPPNVIDLNIPDSMDIALVHDGLGNVESVRLNGTTTEFIEIARRECGDNAFDAAELSSAQTKFESKLNVGGSEEISLLFRIFSEHSPIEQGIAGHNSINRKVSLFYVLPRFSEEIPYFAKCPYPDGINISCGVYVHLAHSLNAVMVLRKDKNSIWNEQIKMMKCVASSIRKLR